MKTRLNSIAAKTAFALFCAVSQSCNPSEQPKPDAEFILSIQEDRQGRILDWALSSSNVISVPVEQQKLQELWVTAHNVCTLTASSADPAFDGVNVSSSNPDKVRIEKEGDSGRTFRLVYAGPTAPGQPVTVTATAGAHSHSFKVSSTKVIDAEYIVLTFTDGDVVEEVRAKAGARSPELSYLKKTIVYRGEPLDPYIEGIGFSIDIIPENCSWTRFAKISLNHDKSYWEGVQLPMSAMSAKKYPKPLKLIEGENYGITMEDLKGAMGWLATGMEPDFEFWLTTGDTNTIKPESTYFIARPRLSKAVDYSDGQ